jgi:hypothetical protein
LTKSVIKEQHKAGVA